MTGPTRLRRAALIAASLFGLSPLAGHLVPLSAHAASPPPPGGIATFTARYVAATAETDPADGEAAGFLNCGTTVPDALGTGVTGTAGGACFDLSSFANQGLVEITQVFPDGPSDTPTTTVFQGYDMDGDRCVACFGGDGDQAAESGPNGVISQPIPDFSGPLQVFVRLASVDDSSTVRTSVTGTVQVTVLAPTDAQSFCGTTAGGCGDGPFQVPGFCTPQPPPNPISPVGLVVCGSLVYPYPGNP